MNRIDEEDDSAELSAVIATGKPADDARGAHHRGSFASVDLTVRTRMTQQPLL